MCPFFCMHWLHSLDQIVYRLGAACFTHTEFARVLYELREDRKHAMASAFAESLRSQSRQEQSRKTLSVKDETPTNILRAKAVMMEDGSRHLIARPALEAARIELLMIETVLADVEPFVHGTIPLAFHAIQKIENTLAVLWKGFIETRAYNQLSIDSLSDMLLRGIHPPDYTSVTDRVTFLQTFNQSPHKSMTPNVLDQLYARAIQVLEESPLLIAYNDALTLDYNNEAFRGILPSSVTTIEPLADCKGLGMLTRNPTA